jgi:two-component system OmpR family response regulator
MSGAQAKRILVVEDDPFVRSTIYNILGSGGFEVTALASADKVSKTLSDSEFSLAILDLTLPDGDGLALTRRIREHYDIGIIIVSGRGEPMDRVIGLEVGADDYLAKPFEPRELLARVRTVLRRFEARAPADQDKRTQRFQFEGWLLDLGGMALTDPGGETVHLTGGEFKLLAALVTHANRVLTRDRLMDLTRDRDAPPFDRSIDMAVGRLRKRLHDSADHPRFIKTVRNGGYVFVAKVTLVE